MWCILFDFYFNSLKSEQAELTAFCSQNVTLNNCITEIFVSYQLDSLSLTGF